jgi:hypothetical protein
MGAAPVLKRLSAEYMRAAGLAHQARRHIAATPPHDLITAARARRDMRDWDGLVQSF